LNKVLAVFLGISILANVILGLMYVGQRATVSQAEEKTQESKKQMVQLKNESHKKEKALTAFQQNESYYEIEHSEEVKRFVDETFKELFNYDNKTYAAHFDQVHNKLAESVISKLKASGEMGSTQIEFSNKVKALNVYLSAVEKDQAKALVNMETQYSVGGSEFPRKNQMYEVTLVQNGDKWLLDKLELMGSFEPFEEN
jgi:Na+-transporting NADH:ubiquinone oxidoreductase subunit NqrC